MSLERWVRLLAGSLVILSLGLAQFYSRGWLLLTLFVGLNLFQSALTGFCPAEAILKRFGLGATACSLTSQTPSKA
ncbi:MAG TPA: DUF2892 domain-containing protein [Candidatus Binataceae bacterium]|nr:DUF2892 domain-containing protein [Candidatus Binataceae bacterium]